MTDKQKLEKLEDAYYSGRRRVRYGDEEVEYQSAEDLHAAIQRLRAKVNKKPSDKRRFASHSKGL